MTRMDSRYSSAKKLFNELEQNSSCEVSVAYEKKRINKNNARHLQIQNFNVFMVMIL